MDIETLVDDLQFDAWLSRIRQAPNGDFEKQVRLVFHEDFEQPNDPWLLYLPGGYPYGQREVDALRARGDTVTTDNVLVRYP